MTVLPPKAAAKLMELRHQADDFNALINSTLSRASDLRRAVQHNPTNPEAANWEFEISRLQAHSAVLQAKVGNATQLLAQLTHFLQTLRVDMKLADGRALKFPLLDGDTHVAAVGRIRLQISALAAELHNVNRSGPTKDEQREASRKYVDGLLAKTKPTVKATHGKFEFSLAPEPSFNLKTSIPAALAWLDRDKFLQHILDAIDAAPEPQLVMTAEAKEKRLADIRAELLKNERIEEWLTSEAAIDDVYIPRRPMANPLAVLGVVFVTAAKQSAAA